MTNPPISGYPIKAPQGGKMTTEVQEKEEQENLGPYRNKYKTEVYTEDDNATLEEDSTDGSEAVDEETISVFSEEENNSEVKTEKHDYKKRYDDLKKHYDSKLHEWREEKETILSESSNQPEEEYDETIETFKENYPDVYNVVEAISTKNASKELEELREEVTRLNEQEEKLKAKGAYQELLALHPDFMELKKSDSFKEWLKVQPPNISNGVLKNSKDVMWASRVVDLYKADIGTRKKVGRPRKQSDARAAEAVTRTNPIAVSTNSNANKKVWTTSEIRKLKPHEFDKFESELDLAREEGRIVNG